jgi:nucleotide-binding universal stress UspA family protein
MDVREMKTEALRKTEMALSTLPNKRLGFCKIVCPVDFSGDSDEALRYAIALAKDYQAKLFILHCADRSEMAGLSNRVAIEQNIERLIYKYASSNETDDFFWDIVLVEGEPAEAIIVKAAELSADLIVMRSRRRPNAVLLGSTAETVSRLAPCPVFVSHPQEQGWVGKSTEVSLKRVLVAYDFSGDSELALAYGLSFAQEYQTELHLLHILPERKKHKAPELSFLPINSDKNYEDAVNRLSSTIPVEALVWCEIKQVLREGLPYREILNYAEEQRMDLICMGASGTDYGLHTLFGSNADRVLRQAPCPIIIARPLRPRQIANGYLSVNND